MVALLLTLICGLGMISARRFSDYPDFEYAEQQIQQCDLGIESEPFQQCAPVNIDLLAPANCDYYVQDLVDYKVCVCEITIEIVNCYKRSCRKPNQDIDKLMETNCGKKHESIDEPKETEPIRFETIPSSNDTVIETVIASNSTGNSTTTTTESNHANGHSVSYMLTLGAILLAIF